MNHELIFTWLGLEPGDWPPNHYRLLGLTPGESDSQLIEQKVHQRMAAVRCYQVRHPDQATEAMNRLAQAFMCLTEPVAKQRYDAEVLGLAPPAPRRSKPETMQEIPAFVPEPPPPNGRRSSPNLVLPPPLPPPAVEVVPAPPAPVAVVPPRPPPAPPAPPVEKVDPILEAARSPLARSGLGSRWELLRRIRRTRDLFESWMLAGKYLGMVKRRTTLRPPDAEELAELFTRIAKQSRRLPRILGEAGQPGYLVLLLAKHDAVAAFRELEPSQREALRRDWQAGRDLLLAHRDFLREQATELRRMTRGQRFGRYFRSLMVDQPRLLLLLLVLAAANSFLWWSWLHRPR